MANVPVSAPPRWAVVAMLFIALCISYVDRGNMAVAALQIQRELNLSTVETGTLLSAFFWTYALCQVPAGAIVDRFNGKWIYAGAFVLWSAASLAMAYLHSFSGMLAARLVLGIGEAVAAPLSVSYIKRAFAPAEQGLPTSVYISGTMLGPAFGAAAGGMLLQSMDWRSMFVLTSLAGALWLLPWLLWAPAVRPKLCAAAEPMPMTGFWQRFFTLQFAWGIAVFSFFYAYYLYFCLSWLPYYFVSARKLSSAKMGLFMSIPLIGMAAVSLLAGSAADRIIRRGHSPLKVRKRFVCAGLIGSAVLVLLVGARSESAVFAILMASMCAVGLAAGNNWAVTQTISGPRVIGKVAGYQNTMAQAGGVCAPLLTGALVGNSQRFDSSIIVASAAPLIAVCAYMLFVRERDAKALQY